MTKFAAERRTLSRLSTLLERSVVDRGLIPVAVIILVYFQYFMWGLYAQHRPDAALIINAQVMGQLRILDIALFSGAVCLLIIGLFLRRHAPDAMLFQHATTQYFGLSLVTISHFVGSLNFCAGLVLLGAPVFGFIILDRKVVWLATATALTEMMVSVYLSATHILPYAPLVIPPTTPASSAFWLLSNLSFATPFFFLIIVLADQALSRWRIRENLIRTMSRTDALTGIHNRRSIIELLEKEVARTMRNGPPLAVVLLDLDFFKRVNDTWGHPTGDRVLRAAADVLRTSIRQNDVVGRYGGEEFLILLPETTFDGARHLIERCRANLAGTTVLADNGETVPMSGSFGLASIQQLAGFSADALIRAADEALYRAKEAGRNRIEAVLI